MLINTHPGCPELFGWYVLLQPGDAELLDQLHAGVTAAAFLGEALDPHIRARPDSPQAVAFGHPIWIGARWFGAVTAQLLAGRTVLVNSCGGWMPWPSQSTLRAMVSSPTLDWPETPDPFERITISRWADAVHWYLSSNKGRVFVPEKHATLEAAKAQALKHVGDGSIHVKMDFAHRREGD